MANVKAGKKKTGNGRAACSKADRDVRGAQKSKQSQAIVLVAILFAFFFVMWTVIESNYGPITPRAIGRGFLLALPVPGLVAITAFGSWYSRSKSRDRLLKSFGLDAEKADLGDPAWFATGDYPPVLLHESMFARDKIVTYHKETIEPNADDHSLSEEYYEVKWVDSHGDKQISILPSTYGRSADPEAIDRFRAYCKRWGIRLRRG